MKQPWAVNEAEWWLHRDSLHIFSIFLYLKNFSWQKVEKNSSSNARFYRGNNVFFPVLCQHVPLFITSFNLLYTALCCLYQDSEFFKNRLYHNHLCSFPNMLYIKLISCIVCWNYLKKGQNQRDQEEKQ